MFVKQLQLIGYIGRSYNISRGFRARFASAGHNFGPCILSCNNLSVSLASLKAHKAGTEPSVKHWRPLLMADVTGDPQGVWVYVENRPMLPNDTGLVMVLSGMEERSVRLDEVREGNRGGVA